MGFKFFEARNCACALYRRKYSYAASSPLCRFRLRRSKKQAFTVSFTPFYNDAAGDVLM